MSIKKKFNQGNKYITILNEDECNNLHKTDKYINKVNLLNMEKFTPKATKLITFYKAFEDPQWPDTDEFTKTYNRIAAKLKSAMATKVPDFYNISTIDTGLYDIQKISIGTGVYQTGRIFSTDLLLFNDVAYVVNLKTAIEQWELYTASFNHYIFNKEAKLFINSAANLFYLNSLQETPADIKEAIAELYDLSNNMAEALKKRNAQGDYGNDKWITNIYPNVEIKPNEPVYGYYNIPLNRFRHKFEARIASYVIHKLGYDGVLYPRTADVSKFKPHDEMIIINPAVLSLKADSEYTWTNWQLGNVINKNFAYNFSACHLSNIYFKYNQHYLAGLANLEAIKKRPSLKTEQNNLSIFSLNVMKMKSINEYANAATIIADFIAAVNYQNADICTFQEAPEELFKNIYNDHFKKDYPHSIFTYNQTRKNCTGLFVMFKEKPANLEIIECKYNSITAMAAKPRNYIICLIKNVYIAFCHIEYFTNIKTNKVYEFVTAIDTKACGQIEACGLIADNLKKSPNAVIVGDFNFTPAEKAYEYLTECGYVAAPTKHTTVSRFTIDYGWCRGVTSHNEAFNYPHSDHNGVRVNVQLNAQTVPLEIEYDKEQSITTRGGAAGPPIYWVLISFIVAILIVLIICIFYRISAPDNLNIAI